MAVSIADNDRKTMDIVSNTHAIWTMLGLPGHCQLCPISDFARSRYIKYNLKY